MPKIRKTGQDLQLPAGPDMITLLRKLTCFFLVITFQLRLLLASPDFFPATNAGAIASQTGSTGSITRADAYDYSSYNHYRYYRPFYRLPISPWRFNTPSLRPHPFSGPAPHHPLPGPAPHHPLPGPAHQHPTPIPVHHPFPSIPAPQPPIPVVAHHPQILRPISPSPDGDDMIRIFLHEHNKVRSSYGASDLTWNPDLISAAKRVTDTCTFRHTVNNQYGENIAAGQTSPDQVVSQWVNGPEEKSAYDPHNPRDSHFTQVVWHGTREVACAVTTCTTLRGASLPQSPIQLWACEYNPPGNVETLYLQNVHASAGGAPLKR